MSLRKKPAIKKGNRNNAAAAAAPTGGGSGGGGLPEAVRGRLWELFGQIEREFEMLHMENASCER